MINRMVKHHLEQQLIENGKNKAIRTGKEVLVSSVSAIDRVNPLAFYTLEAAKYAGNRFFWSDPYQNTIFVGLGRAMLVEAHDAAMRFQEIEQQWREIIEQALISEDAPDCAGPLFFGGFSFDTEKPQSKLWRHFPHTRFVMPEHMLTITGGKAWLTTNRLISPWKDSEDSVEQLELPLNLVYAETGAKRAPHIQKEEIAPTDWMHAVEEAVQSIRQAQLDKVVLARQLNLSSDQEFVIADILSRLFQEQKNTFIFALEQDDSCFIGATPERLVKSNGNQFLTNCLAGSIARGKTIAEDELLGNDLCYDHKNLREHALALQMIQEAMNEVCATVSIPDMPTLYKCKDIQHLYTPIMGHANTDVSILKVVEALHPTPAVGGMPRDTSMQMIRKLEQMDRGWYAAPVGWLNRKMDGEFAVAIRSALVQGNNAALFAGCGIVGDSDPDSEFNETALKFRPMLSALRALEEDA